MFNPDEPYVYVVRRERLPMKTDWAFFILAYESMAAWFVERAFGPDSTKFMHDAIKALNERQPLSELVADPEPMLERIDDFRVLRNELTHRIGAWAPSSSNAESLERLAAAEDISKSPDPEEHADNLIRITNLSGLLDDMQQIVNVYSYGRSSTPGELAD